MSYLASPHQGTLHALARPFARRPVTLCGIALPAVQDRRPAHRAAWCRSCVRVARGGRT